MKKIALLAVLAVLALAGPVLAPTSPTATAATGATGAAGSAVLAGDNSCPDSASRCIYRLPDHLTTARTACIRAEREDRGIPGNRHTYIEWFEANRGTSAWSNWRAAYQACLDRHQLPGGKWAWDQMVFVRAEGTR